MVRLIYSRSGIAAARIRHPDHGRAVEAINTSVNVVKGNRADVLSRVVLCPMRVSKSEMHENGFETALKNLKAWIPRLNIVD